MAAVTVDTRNKKTTPTIRRRDGVRELWFLLFLVGLRGEREKKEEEGERDQTRSLIESCM